MEKKNTILLTVIAVATLLVAMVGATFAYFTAQRGDGAQADITVTTSTSDSIIYGEFNQLLVKATQQNFDQTAQNSQRGSTEGKITLTASDNEGRQDEADYCYTSIIKISENEFGYKPAEVADGEEAPAETPKPELILSLYYNGTEYKQQVGDLKYTTITDTQKVCDQENGITNEESCQDNQTIAGYDITTIGNESSSEDEPPAVPSEPTTTNIQIPVQVEDPSTAVSEMSYIHHIKSSEAGGKVEVTWKASVTFVNYDFDQQYNTDKKFVAVWEFTPVDCETDGPSIP